MIYSWPSGYRFRRYLLLYKRRPKEVANVGLLSYICIHTCIYVYVYLHMFVLGTSRRLQGGFLGSKKYSQSRHHNKPQQELHWSLQAIVLGSTSKTLIFVSTIDTANKMNHYFQERSRHRYTTYSCLHVALSGPPSWNCVQGLWPASTHSLRSSTWPWRWNLRPQQLCQGGGPGGYRPWGETGAQLQNGAPSHPIVLSPHLPSLSLQKHSIKDGPTSDTENSKVQPCTASSLGSVL